MKHRVTLSLVVFSAFLGLTQVVCADPTVSPKRPLDKPFQDMGRDVAQDGWSDWQAPVGTVDPGRLISTDNASNASAHFDSVKLAATLDHGKPAQIEKTKSIVEVETTTADIVTDQPPAVTATATPKGGSKKMVWIGGACLAFLAFRLFRRPSNIPKKPRYL